MKLLCASIALPSVAVLQLILLLLLIIQVFQTPATILAQRFYSINLYDCPDTSNKYATGSQFEKNLKNLFPSLISHGSRDGGFFNTSSGAGQDIIYGLVQCRFDVSKDDCRRCLSIASVLILKKCPHQMDAVIRYEDCLFRYSNVIFFSQLRILDDLEPKFSYWDNITIIDVPAFNKQLKVLFTNLTSLAISKPSKYQTGSSNFSLLSGNNIIIYGLVECTRDLSNTDCRYCLQYMFSKIRDCCSGYKSAWVLSLSCQIWYRDLKFFEPPIHLPIQQSTRTSPRTTHPDSLSPRTSPGSPSPRTSPDSPSPAANVTGDTNGTKNKTHQENSKARIYMVVIPVVAAVVLFAFAFSICLLRRKATREKAHRGTMQTSAVHLEGAASSPSRYFELNESERKGVDVPFVDFDTILTATDNFSISNKLGQGGFGPVYKGTFKGGQELAVKRLSRSSGQGLEEFRNEVLLIAKLQHRNLVKLLGYCIKDDEKVLLYEYMPNKSLDSFIFDRTLSLTINWEKRLDIILGIARGILYLHQDSRLRIIHRDLKTSNILLDEEMNPKISDFGLARICGGTETEGSTNRVVGTYGYMAPEYALDGLFSVKSDVYSFGVVLLEIVSGKKNSGFHVSEDSLSFIRYAWRLWNENKVLDFLDDSLCEACNGSEVFKCIQVGLLCVQEDADDRPTMSSAVFMLGSEATNLPTPKQPAFVFRRCRSSTTTSSGIPESCSKNEITVSGEEGR